MAQPTRFQRMRSAAYLAMLRKNDPSLTRSKIAQALGVTASRVSQWLRAQRGVGPATAFEHGEMLATALHVETSGLEAVYAAGFWQEFFNVLMHLAADRANGGNALAVTAYCTLPACFRDFDRDSADAALKHLLQSDPLEHQRVQQDHRRDITLLHSDEAGQRTIDRADWSSRIDANVKVLRGPETRNAIKRAWQHLLAGSPPMLTFAQGDDPKLYPGEDSLKLAEVVITLAGRMNNAIPALSGIRLWRMAAEWASTAENSFYNQRDLLPDPQSTFDAVDERVGSNDAYEYELGMQAMADSYYGR